MHVYMYTYMRLIFTGFNPNPSGYRIHVHIHVLSVGNTYMYNYLLIYVVHRFKYSYSKNVWSQARPRNNERLKLVSIFESLCFSIDIPRDYMYIVNKTILRLP
jgi:hypothetical protein